ncbi:MAG TPA: endonuclease/exonuclease/phosphatase family protein [Bacillota bacterium]|nr:endonuclease/exonuclease/phosphatase family protein [Bacillota bacterium]
MLFLFLLLVGLYNKSSRDLWCNRYSLTGISKPTDQVKVMTFNIRGGRDNQRHVQMNQIIKEIKENQPDIVGLQEVDVSLPRSGFLNEIEMISNQLHMNYIFVPTINFVVGAYGDAILSKYPIVSYASYRLPGGIEPRGMIRADVTLRTQKISVYTTHLGLGQVERGKQFAAVESIIKNDLTPKIVLGDFNTKPKETNIVTFKKRFVETTNQVEKTFITLPSEKTQIDYVLYTKEFQSVDQYVGHSVISDHNPLLCTLLVYQ